METNINSVNGMSPTVSNNALSTDKVSSQKKEFIAASTERKVETGYGFSKELKTGQLSGEQAIDDKVSELNDFVQNIQRGIQFSVQEETGRSIITVSDKETGEIIRTFPSEQMLDFAAYVAENKAQPDDVVRGLLVNERS